MAAAGTAGWDINGISDRLSDALDSPDVQTGLKAAAGVLAFLVFVGILYPAPISILFLGVVLGSLSALIAMAIVLTYRSNQVINFAVGDLGGVAAIFAASLIVGLGWPFFPAVIVAFICALGLGAVTEILVIRRFAKAPRLILTVVTIGLQQLFFVGQLLLPRAFGYDVIPQPPTPFNWHFEWHPVTFRGGHLLIVMVVPAVTVGLAAFFRYTRIGVAVRAAAESADRAALLGVPVKRVQTLVWVIAAGLSALAVLLRMPIQGVSIGGVLGPTLLLRALAAAVLGRMEMPRTFAWALVLGMIEQAALFVTGRVLIVDALMFGLILAGLLLQRRGLGSRAEAGGVSTWSVIKEVRPIPGELRDVPIVRWTQAGVGGVVAALLLAYPLRMSPGDVNLLGVGLVFGIIMLSLALLTGMAGQISLAPLAFAAWGAAVAGSLAQHGWNFFLAILGAGLVGAFVAVLVGIPALRIQGLFLAVTSLGFAIATGEFFLNREFFPWLVPDPAQRVFRPLLFGKFDLETEHTYYYATLAIFVVVLISIRSLRNSRSGRVLVATRDNVRAAQSYGISPIRARLSAFAMSGFFSALAGGVYMYNQHGLPSSSPILDTVRNLTVFAIAVIGGLGSMVGALVGAVYLMFVFYSSLTRTTAAQFLATGVGALFVLILFPGGLGGVLYDVRDNLLRRVARAQGIVVPSLLADVRVDEHTGEPDDASLSGVDVESLPTIELGAVDR